MSGSSEGEPERRGALISIIQLLLQEEGKKKGKKKGKPPPDPGEGCCKEEERGEVQRKGRSADKPEAKKPESAAKEAA